MTTLNGATALVTGAGSGVGRAIALALGDRGSDLILVGRREPELKLVARELASSGARAECCSVDLESEGEIDDLARYVAESFGGLDVLVHSAGTFSMGPATDAPVQDLDRQYSVNLRGPYVLNQATLPLLRERTGQVVYLNSTAGLSAPAGVSQYAATKHGLKALADGLRMEVNPLGIRVLSIYLGRTASPMQEAIHSLEGRAYRPERLIQPEDVATLVVQILALPRSVEVTDVRLRPMSKPT